MGIVTKINAGGTNHLVASSAYGTCSTAAGTAAKTVTLSDFDTLTAGVTIHVRFTYSNTAANPTLNVNSKGAKSIYAYGTTAPGTTVGTSWQAGAVVSFTYNTDNNSSGCWVMNNYIADTDTDNDTKVTSSANHYTPSTASGNDKTASASGATAAWSIDVVKGVTINTDGKGHITGLSVTSGKIPANPNTDTNTTYSLSGALSSHKFTSTLTAGGSGSGTSTSDFTLAAGTGISITDDTTNRKMTIGNSGVTSITTSAGAHSTKSSVTGAVSFNVPTKTSHLTNDSGFITSYTDTKNTAGSNNTSSKIFLIGATTQAASPQTYSHDTAYVGTDGCLYSGGYKTLTTADATTTGEAGKIMQSVTGTGALTIGTSLFFTRVNTNYLQIPNFQVSSDNFLNYYATGHRFDSSIYIGGHDYPIGHIETQSVANVNIASGAWKKVTEISLSEGTYMLTYSVMCETLASGKRLGGAFQWADESSILYGSRSLMHASGSGNGAVTGSFCCEVSSDVAPRTIQLMCYQTQGNTQQCSGYIRSLRIL